MCLALKSIIHLLSVYVVVFITATVFTATCYSVFSREEHPLFLKLLAPFLVSAREVFLIYQISKYCLSLTTAPEIFISVAFFVFVLW